MAQRLIFQRLLVRRVCVQNSHTTSVVRRTPAVLRHHTSGNNIRWLHSTSPIRKSDEAAKQAEESKKEAETNEETKLSESTETKQDDDDDIPAWQNPLHHNNPEMEKIFVEDFEPGEEMPIVPLPPMAKEGSNVQAPQHIHDLADEILNLSMLEMKQLVDKVAEHFGFDTQAVAMSLGGGGAGASDGGGGDEEAKEEEAVEEKTLFDLKLTGFDAKSKIKVIKEVRSIAELGLKEAKELVEGAPKVIKKDIKKEEAEELQKKLEEVGATIEIV